MSSFIAAGTAYATHGINMIPFFIYYSMFGFQRIGDLIWAAADCRAKGFLIGGTAGRTTLNGEGLQHQDGHSLLNAIAFPTVRAYDPAFAYETTVIVLDGMKRMYEDGEDAIYYITVGNENYRHPPMPEGVEEGIIRGIYKFIDEGRRRRAPKVQLFGSGAILREALRAQDILAEQVPDFEQRLERDQLHRAAPRRAGRRALEHAASRPSRRASRTSKQVLAGEKGPFIAASDYVRALAEQISPWVPGGLFALGTDGFGRSEDREQPAAALRSRCRVHHGRRACISWPKHGQVSSATVRRQGDQEIWASTRKRSNPTRGLSRSATSFDAHDALSASSQHATARNDNPGVEITWRLISSCPTWARTSSRATSSACWSRKATRSRPSRRDRDRNRQGRGRAALPARRPRSPRSTCKKARRSKSATAADDRRRRRGDAKSKPPAEAKRRGRAGRKPKPSRAGEDRAEAEAAAPSREDRSGRGEASAKPAPAKPQPAAKAPASRRREGPRRSPRPRRRRPARPRAAWPASWASIWRRSPAAVRTAASPRTTSKRPSANDAGAPPRRGLGAAAVAARRRRRARTTGARSAAQTMSGIRKTIAVNMARSASTIPHVTNFDDADITELERIRKGGLADYVGTERQADDDGVRHEGRAPSRSSCTRWSTPRSTWRASEIIYKDYVNIGVAVDTERGLVVPVIRDVDQHEHSARSPRR